MLLVLGSSKQKSVLCMPQGPHPHLPVEPWCQSQSNMGGLPSDGLGPAHANVSPGHCGEPGVQGRCSDSAMRGDATGPAAHERTVRSGEVNAVACLVSSRVEDWMWRPWPRWLVPSPWVRLELCTTPTFIQHSLSIQIPLDESLLRTFV